MATYNFNKTPANAGRLQKEIDESAITIVCDSVTVLGSSVTTVFRAALSQGEETILNDIVTAHTGEPLPVEASEVTLSESKAKDGLLEFIPVKAYKEDSLSFTTPDYANPCTWFYDTTSVAGEVLNTADNTIYTSGRSITQGWNHYWLHWERIPNSARRDFPSKKLKVYKNDVVITSGFTVNHANGTITFSQANLPEDVIKVDYTYGNSANFELIAKAGKKLLVDYVECQFSVGCIFDESSPIIFQAVYNGPAIPSLGIPANYDVPVSNYYYYNADDYLNESTGVSIGKPFGRLTQEWMILPWNYITGHTIKPVGDSSTDLNQKEFNKLKCSLTANKPVTNCEIATATFYCRIKDL